MRRQPNPPVKFTARIINNLPTGDKPQSWHDTEIKELGVLVQPTGHKSYFMFFRVERGKPGKWITLGDTGRLTVDDARAAARLKLGDLEKWKLNGYTGDSPIAPPPQDITLSALLDDYIARHLLTHAKRPDFAVKNARWMAERYLKRWLNRPLNRITRKEVSALHHDLGQKHGAYTANRVIQQLRAMFNFAINPNVEHFKGPNPAANLKKFPETNRSRFLSDAELAQLFAALEELKHGDLTDFVMLSLFTGARKSDILSMRWADITKTDAGKVWTIPNPKNRTPYVVPLTKDAVAVLNKRPHILNNPWVFPSFGKSGHLIDLKKQWKALVQKAGLANLRIHDLRRTQGSKQATLGVPLHFIGKSLGHQSLQATQVYARFGTEPVRAALNASNTAIAVAMRKGKS